VSRVNRYALTLELNAMVKQQSLSAEASPSPDDATRPLSETKPADPARLERIREIAHSLYLERGGAPGDELADWLKAEQQVDEGLQ
jgi:hypothetical protein